MSFGQILLIAICVVFGPVGWLLLFALWAVGYFERDGGVTK